MLLVKESLPSKLVALRRGWRKGENEKERYQNVKQLRVTSDEANLQQGRD
jgi:hypothetical protein